MPPYKGWAACKSAARTFGRTDAPQPLDYGQLETIEVVRNLRWSIAHGHTARHFTLDDATRLTAATLAGCQPRYARIGAPTHSGRRPYPGPEMACVSADFSYQPPGLNGTI